MILVAGLSPAWQRILTFDELRPGEVNRAKTVSECASGKAINVALALKSLGEAPILLTVLGGVRGALLAESLHSELRLDSEALRVVGETRICQTLLSRSGSPTTELVEECAPLSDSEVSRFLDLFDRYVSQAAVVVLTGSLPPNVPSDLYATLLRRVRVPAIVDAQGDALTQALPAQPLVVKPNREELARTLGRPLVSEADVVAAANDLRERGAQHVVVSNGAAPLLVVGNTGVQRVHPPRVEHPVNPIGCGDSFTAGLAARLAQGGSSDWDAAVAFGVACAAANLTASRPAALVPEVVESYRAKVRVEPIF